MLPIEPVNFSVLLPPLQTSAEVLPYKAAVPATAFLLTAITNILVVDEGQGLLESTALYAVEAVNDPVLKVAVVPVAVAHVGVVAV